MENADRTPSAAQGRLAARVDELERRLDAMTPRKFRKPPAPSLTPPPCDCDRFGVVHVMTPECPIWDELPTEGPITAEEMRAAS